MTCGRARAGALVLAGLAAFGLASGSGIAAMAQEVPSPPSSFVVTPAEPVPGQRVTAEVAGFAPGATVEVFVDGEQAQPIAADHAGRATATIELDGTRASSRHVVIAGENPNGVRQATTGVIDSRWPEGWAQGDADDPTTMAILATSIGVLLAGSGVVIATHRRRVAAAA